ncbi:MAG: GntR family transcriptional regulator [Clostridiales Family XIII bacterium]|jgi:DNA-binding GntR family transcriptional regulator|nr:GntR family transcriptional regulator [Clostridiales Family XIII bacterium]
MQKDCTTYNIIAYDAIMKKLLNGDLIPGDMVSEESIAKELDVSRTPIREAILWMQKDGYLDVFPRKGTFVSKSTIKELLDVYKLRSILEPDSIALIMPIENADTITELAKYREYNMQYIEDCSSVVPRGDFFLSDFELHLFLFSQIKNRMIESVCKNSLFKCIISKQQLLDSLHIKHSRVAVQHIEWIDAILNNRKDDFKTLYRLHIKSEKNALLQIFDI